MLGMEMRVLALEDVLVTRLVSPFEHAFFLMLEGLGVLPEAKPTTGGHETRVRVLNRHCSAAAHVG